MKLNVENEKKLDKAQRMTTVCVREQIGWETVSAYENQESKSFLYDLENREKIERASTVTGGRTGDFLKLTNRVGKWKSGGKQKKSRADEDDNREEDDTFAKKQNGGRPGIISSQGKKVFQKRSHCFACGADGHFARKCCASPETQQEYLAKRQKQFAKSVSPNFSSNNTQSQQQ